MKQIIQAIDMQVQTTHNQTISQPERTRPPAQSGSRHVNGNDPCPAADRNGQCRGPAPQYATITPRAPPQSPPGRYLLPRHPPGRYLSMGALRLPPPPCRCQDTHVNGCRRRRRNPSFPSGDKKQLYIPEVGRIMHGGRQRQLRGHVFQQRGRLQHGHWLRLKCGGGHGGVAGQLRTPVGGGRCPRWGFGLWATDRGQLAQSGVIIRDRFPSGRCSPSRRRRSACERRVAGGQNGRGR